MKNYEEERREGRKKGKKGREGEEESITTYFDLILRLGLREA